MTEENAKTSNEMSEVNANSDGRCQPAESSNLALKAAMEASAAKEAQQPAAQKAAHAINEQLADKACEAANTAQAALSGKTCVIAEITKELKGSNAVLKEETIELQQLQQTAQAGSRATQDIKQMCALLHNVMQLAKKDSTDAQMVMKGLLQLISVKQKLIDAAKRRCEKLTQQLKEAQEDLEKTKEAANKAQSAASEAKEYASRLARRSFKGNMIST